MPAPYSHLRDEQRGPDTPAEQRVQADDGAGTTDEQRYLDHEVERAGVGGADQYEVEVHEQPAEQRRVGEQAEQDRGPRQQLADRDDPA